MKRMSMRGASVATVLVVFILAAALGPEGISSLGILFGAVAGIGVAWVANKNNNGGFYSAVAALGTLLFIAGIVSLASTTGTRGLIDIAVGSAFMIIGLRNRPKA